MNPYYNLPPEQRRVQQLVALFNADELLWRSLEDKRRLRRRLYPRISASLRKHFDLLDFGQHLGSQHLGSGLGSDSAEKPSDLRRHFVQ